MRSMVKKKTKRMKDMLAIHSTPLYFDIFPTSRKTSVASCRAKTTEPTRVNLQEEEGIIKMQMAKRALY